MDASVELDGIAVEGNTVVMISCKPLTPERAEALTADLAGFARRAVAAGAEDDDPSLPRLADPLNGTR